MIRVFQVATGNVGTQMIQRLQRHREVELAGLHCYSPEKVGRDAGEIAGIDAVPAVVAGPPGIVTSADLPLRAFGGRFVDAAYGARA